MRKETISKGALHEAHPIDKRFVSSDDPFLPEYFRLIGTDVMSNADVNNPSQAMRLATAYRCMAILSGTIASLPLEIRRLKKGGFFDVDTDHDLFPILTWKASKRQTFHEMMENAIMQIHNEGNAYIFIKRRGVEIEQLILLENSSVNYDKFRNVYHISDWVNGITGVYEDWQVIHLKNKSLDGGYTGVSTIQFASRTLSVTANADNQALKELKGDNRYRGFISGGDVATGMGKIQDGQIDVVKKRLSEELALGESIMRLPAGVKFEPLSISPADAQLLETRKFSVFEICRFYGVHPDKVFAEASANYKASENSQVSFLTDTLQPILAKIVAEFTAKLIPRSVISKYKLEYDLAALYQVDLSTKATYYKNMLEIGAYTPNEIRRRENRAPVEGGDTVLVTCNVAALNSPKIRGEEGTPKPEKETDSGKEDDKTKKR